MKRTYKLIRTFRPNREFPFGKEGQVFEIESERIVEHGGRLGIPNPDYESKIAIGQMSPRFIATFEEVK